MPLSVKYIVVHHSAGGFHQTAADIKQIHLAKGYTDIGYHKVIESDGDVIQGRADAVIGAQAFGLNSASLGICVIGNFQNDEPKKLQVDALVQVLAVLCKRHKLSVDKIIGHRDVAGIINDPTVATACPGDKLYSKLPDIRNRVKAYL